jgi:hypothetical protein
MRIEKVPIRQPPDDRLAASLGMRAGRLEAAWSPKWSHAVVVRLHWKLSEHDHAGRSNMSNVTPQSRRRFLISGRDVPFFPNYDASADVIRQHFARRNAACAAIMAAQSSSNAALLFGVRSTGD